jgi:hypothetical protein
VWEHWEEFFTGRCTYRAFYPAAGLSPGLIPFGFGFVVLGRLSSQILLGRKVQFILATQIILTVYVKI